MVENSLNVSTKSGFGVKRQRCSVKCSLMRIVFAVSEAEHKHEQGGRLILLNVVMRQHIT